MCICTLTSHSTHTACPCAVDLCTQPFALENCLWLPVSSWSLGNLTAKPLLIQITRELCSPCSYQSAAPVVVNTSVPPRSPLCQLYTHKTLLYLLPVLYSLIFHSVGDFQVNNRDMRRGACMHSPSINTHTHTCAHTHPTTFQSFSW